MFAKVFDIFRRDFFPIADSDLSIISRIAQAFIVVKFHIMAPHKEYSVHMLHMQRIKWKNLTKKDRISAVLKGFI